MVLRLSGIKAEKLLRWLVLSLLHHSLQGLSLVPVETLDVVGGWHSYTLTDQVGFVKNLVNTAVIISIKSTILHKFDVAP